MSAVSPLREGIRVGARVVTPEGAGRVVAIHARWTHVLIADHSKHPGIWALLPTDVHLEIEDEP